MTEKTMLVIGAGLLGSAASIELARTGVTVAIADIRPEAAEATAAKIRAEGGRAASYTVDIADGDSICAAVVSAAALNDRLDGLFFNAYEGPVARQDNDIVNIDLDIWRRMLEGTLTGSLIAMRAAIPVMLKTGGGGIVCTSSSDAFDSPPKRVGYPVSKFALHGLVRHVAARWGSEGIRCNVIAPGLVPPRLPNGEFPPDRKEFYEAFIARTPSARGGEPRDIGAMVRFLLGDEGSWINGQCLSVDGGLILR